MKKNGLPEHQQNRHACVSDAMRVLKSMETFAEKVKDEEEIADDENRINHQLNQKGS